MEDTIQSRQWPIRESLHGCAQYKSLISTQTEASAGADQGDIRGQSDKDPDSGQVQLPLRHEFSLTKDSGKDCADGIYHSYRDACSTKRTDLHYHGF
jgi:hypothetical protein